MRAILSFLCAVIGVGPIWADTVAFDGAIGPYGIEVELTLSEEALSGRYRYVGRDVWLDLTGETFGADIMQLDESVDGAPTGSFYLETTGAGLEGFWAGGEADHPVRLIAREKATQNLFAPSVAVEVGDWVTGRYSTTEYWINDWFAPSYEIGFNGGNVSVVKISHGEILVEFNFVVGPTYHIASFVGVATRDASGDFIFDDARGFGSDESCRLVFAFQDRTLEITDIDNGYACGFGARAHANFTLQKISDTAEFDGQW